MIQDMIKYVQLLLIAFSGKLNVGDAVITNTKFERDVNFEGKIDDTNILRTTNDMTSMRCATSCDNDPNCVAFYINPTTRTCQEQSAYSNTEMIGLTSSPGFRYYHNELTPPATFECPIQNDDWSFGQLPDGMYSFKIFNDVSVNQTTAFAMCQSIGSNLPKIYEVEKMNFYLQNIFTCPDVYTYRFWVDGTNINAPDKTSSDAWTTHDGITISMSLDLWSPARPNMPFSQHCIQSRLEDFNYMFDDYFCGYETNQVLCEKKISS